MKLRNILLFGIAMLMYGSSAFAQDDPPKWEVYGEYSYLRFNPSLSYLKNRSFNGGGGGVSYFFNKYFGIKGEFMGYGSTNFTIPAGTYNFPRLSPDPIVLTAPVTTQGNMFTYQFGPVLRYPVGKITPFGEVLFGGSNSNAYGNQVKGICTEFECVSSTTNITGTQHPFTMLAGGGLDVKVSKNFSIRPIEIDYMLTRYTNPITQTNNQNSFRYSAGVVFHF